MYVYYVCIEIEVYIHICIYIYVYIYRDIYRRYRGRNKCDIYNDGMLVRMDKSHISPISLIYHPYHLCHSPAPGARGLGALGPETRPACGR